LSTLIDQRTTLEQLFSGYPLERFIDQFLHRLPFALPNAAEPFCSWGQGEILNDILKAPDNDVMVVRANEQYTGDLPRDSTEARVLSEKGYTVLVRHVERHHSGIAKLADEFSRVFCAPVDAHIYATPSNQYGFSWHYDAEDVFILQLTGEKTYGLRKNTVNPWPLEEALPHDMQYGRELMPLMQVKLNAGDMLYIPCGYWHRGVVGESSETAISLAIGVMSRSAVDVFDKLRPRILDSILWRQRLPVVIGDAPTTNVVDLYSTLLDMLATDLGKTLRSSEFLKGVLNDRGRGKIERE
jgi:50S ribosomal protein L16 3-hydroxylase